LDVPALPPALIGEDGEELGELEAEESGESRMLDAELSGRDKESMFLLCFVLPFPFLFQIEVVGLEWTWEV
jgi:hypothetical protein